MGPNYIKTYSDTLDIGVHDDYFTIDFVDSGILYWNFSKFSGGCQYAIGQSSKIELFYDADGTAENLELIDTIYTASETYQHEFDPNIKYSYTSNVSRVLVRRTLYSLVSVQVYAQWQGQVS